MSYHDTRSMVTAPWDLDALKNEFEELILLDAPIEITGFSPAEMDHVVLGDAEGLELGPAYTAEVSANKFATPPEHDRSHLLW